MIDVYDDVLEEHNAILIDDAVKKLAWRYDYYSDPNKPNKHWHVFCGNDIESCTNSGYEWAHSLYVAFTKKFDFIQKYNIEKYERISKTTSPKTEEAKKSAEIAKTETEEDDIKETERINP